MNHGRAYSTDFKDHEKLLHKFTKGGFARLRGAGIDGIEYEDVYQEMCVSFVRAAKSYNPDAGITFTAYMGRAVINNFNKHADRLIRENESVGHLKIGDLVGDSPCDSEGDGVVEMMDRFMMGNIMSDISDQEETVLSREAGRINISRLSAASRKVIRDLISPSKELVAHHRAELAQSIHAKAIGAPSKRIYEEIDLKYIVKYHGLRFKHFNEEVIRVLGVDLS